MPIYDIPGIFSKWYPLVANPINITPGFRQAGIVPFDREGFHSRADYDPGFVTDRKDPTLTVSVVEMEMPVLDEPFYIATDIFPDEVEPFTEPEVENFAVEPELEQNSVNSDVEVGVRKYSLLSFTPSSVSTIHPNSQTVSSGSSRKSIGILAELRAFPNAGPRTAPKNNVRRKRTFAVLTDSPVKSVTEAEKAAVKTKAARKVFSSKKSSK